MKLKPLKWFNGQESSRKKNIIKGVLIGGAIASVVGITAVQKAQAKRKVRTRTRAKLAELKPKKASWWKRIFGVKNEE